MSNMLKNITLSTDLNKIYPNLGGETAVGNINLSGNIQLSGTAIGDGSGTESMGMVVGPTNYSVAKNMSLVVGKKCEALGCYSVAIGSSSKAYGQKSMAQGYACNAGTVELVNDEDSTAQHAEGY